MITLPDEIHLTAMRKTWTVTYMSMPGRLMLIEEPHRELIVCGRGYSKAKALRAIYRWIRIKAERHLREQLEKLSKKTKIKYDKIYFYPYRYEWGNYSEDKIIGLNYLLIFLPPALVKHIIYHELCHSFTMKHSEKFWHTLAKYDKNWKKNRKALEDAYDHIPEWAENL